MLIDNQDKDYKKPSVYECQRLLLASATVVFILVFLVSAVLSRRTPCVLHEERFAAALAVHGAAVAGSS